MTYSIINKSQFEGTQRIDAEYYQPEYLYIRKLIERQKHLELGKICSKFKKGIFDIKADSYTETGIPFIRISNLKGGLVSSNNIAFINIKAHEKEKNTALQCGDIVLSKTAYPAASLILFEQANISQDIIGLSLRKDVKKEVLPEYLVVFLNSKFGIAEMQQWFQGNIQMHLALPDAKRILIPKILIKYQEMIRDLFKLAERQLENSQLLYSQAENLLLEELGLKGFGEENDLFLIMKFDDVLSANRIDAEYFQSKYLRLKEKLKSKSQPLLKFVQNVTAKFEPAKEPDKEFKYVELSNINSVNGLIDGYEAVLGKEAPSRARRILRAGDVIVSSVEGSLNKVALVLKEQEGYLASTGFFQFRSNKIAPEVLLILMKSIVMQWQLKQNCAGTILTAVPSEALNKMYIPEISQSVAEQIIIFVTESHTARQKSKELLSESKRKVEEMIEKGGD